MQLAIILARGGSKRIPNKNIRLFNGLPTVAWPVKSALASDCFDAVYISTDSPEIEGVACSYGALSLGPRPSFLANDFATTEDVLSDFLATLQNKKQVFPQYLCCLYGTSVFITPKIIHAGLQRIKQETHDFVFAISQYTHPIERALVFTEKETVQYIHPENALRRTQDCPQSYYDLGLFYWLNTKTFMEQKSPSFKNLNKTALLLSPTDAVDIDTEEDWLWAEQLAQIKMPK